MDNLYWLEIDGTDIIGVHSVKGQSDYTWVSLSEGEDMPDPGDNFIDGKVVQRQAEIDPPQEKRILAQQKIIDVYPLWKQMNILRNGTEVEQTTMGRFIDAVRTWSNNPKSTVKQLDKIVP
ncbi:hypothetical protein [Teredinibacter sp. KSP-S5-2]|uniref:hypothetical protein n=1 Tax=Teredinibacter sp. KSP-S5-2 TaxID=3034506 RepID=UPI002934EF06|nr:hypothetical protein [Teredinibacter sp. KSP-S5-2]WNO10552.1 hypothetical protein P5V12_05135 [Teredinibacter sp. KSP-S5-2]